MKKNFKYLGLSAPLLTMPLLVLSCDDKLSLEQDALQKANNEQKFVNNLDGSKTRTLGAPLEGISSAEFNTHIADQFGIFNFVPKSNFIYTYSHEPVTASGVKNIEVKVSYQTTLSTSAVAIPVQFIFDDSIVFFNLKNYASPSKLTLDLTAALNVTMPESGLTIFNEISDENLAKVKSYTEQIDVAKKVQFRLNNLELTLDFSNVKQYVDQIKSIIQGTNATSLKSLYPYTKLTSIGTYPNAPLISSLTAEVIGAHNAQKMISFLALARPEDATKQVGVIAANHPYFKMLHSYHEIINLFTSSHLFKHWNVGLTYDLLTQDLDYRAVKSGELFDQGIAHVIGVTSPKPTNEHKLQMSNFEAQFGINLLNIRPRSNDEKVLAEAVKFLNESTQASETTTLNPFAFHALEISEGTVIDLYSTNNIIGFAFPSHIAKGITARATKVANNSSVNIVLSKGESVSVEIPKTFTEFSVPTVEEMNSEQRRINEFVPSQIIEFSKSSEAKNNTILSRYEKTSYGFKDFTVINGIQMLITHAKIESDGMLSFSIKTRFVKTIDGNEQIIIPTIDSQSFSRQVVGIDFQNTGAKLQKLNATTLSENTFKSLTIEKTPLNESVASQLGISLPQDLIPSVNIEVSKNANESHVTYKFSKDGVTITKTILSYFISFAN